jgi:hypothetical protein
MSISAEERENWHTSMEDMNVVQHQLTKLLERVPRTGVLQSVAKWMGEKNHRWLIFPRGPTHAPGSPGREARFVQAPHSGSIMQQTDQVYMQTTNAGS